MECRQCGKEIAGEDYKMVAEWPFCPECFQKLMEKPAKKAEAEVDTEKKDMAVKVVVETGKPRCQVCEKEIEGDQYKKVGIWVFCPDCYTDMAPRRKPPPPPEAEEEAGEAEEAEALSPMARFKVKYMHRVTCTGCSKRIPEGGGREVDGEPYCPECYYALPEETRQAAEKAEPAEISREEEVEVPEVEAAPGCESCGKQVPEETLQRVEGFAICQACLSADDEMAVHLARARHQKRLQRLKDELGS